MRKRPVFHVFALVLLLTLGGCLSTQSSTTSGDPDTTSGIARNEPYFPTKFNDLEIPGELQQDLRQTMFVNTSSFTGGILNFTGRVEVGSLTDFFINSMQKNGWKLVGEVRYENVMLAFNKPSKNCMFSIYPGEFAGKTKVYVYLTADLQANVSEQNL